MKKTLSILIIVFLIISSMMGCSKPLAPVNPIESQINKQPDSSNSPTNSSPSSLTSSPSPSMYIETYGDETHIQIQYGKLSLEIPSYHHIVYRTQNGATETYKCDIDTGLSWKQPRKVTIIVIRKIEKQHFSDTEQIVSYLRDMSPNYERIEIYDHVSDKSWITSLYSVTGGGLTDYIVCYWDACYFIESDYYGLDNYLFTNSFKPNYSEDKLFIECADSYITDVNQSVYHHKNEFVKAEYNITQGKDGTTYTAELIRDDSDYHFTLQNANGENLLTLSTYGPFDEMVKFIDINMDGYADVQFLEQPGTWNNIHALYLWDDTAQNFVKVKCDEMLSHIEARDGYVLNWQKEDIESGVIQTLVWDQNTLILESEEPYIAGN